MNRCDKCGEYYSDPALNRHSCPPAWHVFHRDYLGDEPRLVYANSIQEAAEKYAEDYDGEDSLLYTAEDIEVQGVGSRYRVIFSISADTEITYSATRLSTKTTPK